MLDKRIPYIDFHSSGASSHDGLQFVAFVSLDAVRQGLWSSEAGGECSSVEKFDIGVAAKGNIDELHFSV